MSRRPAESLPHIRVFHIHSFELFRPSRNIRCSEGTHLSCRIGFPQKDFPYPFIRLINTFAEHQVLLEETNFSCLIRFTQKGFRETADRESDLFTRAHFVCRGT